MRGLAILILVVLFFWLCWPYLARWIRRMAMRKAESYIRKKMGMPPPPRGGKKQKQETPRRRPHAPIIPKEYAEDAEFTEIIEYTSYEARIHTRVSTEEYHESQVSDAEWIEIKSGRP